MHASTVINPLECALTNFDGVPSTYATTVRVRVPSYRPQVPRKCNSRSIDARNRRAQDRKCNREFSKAGGDRHGYYLFAPVRRIAACERSRPVGPAGLSFGLRPSNPPRPSGRNPHRPLTFFSPNSSSPTHAHLPHPLTPIHPSYLLRIAPSGATVMLRSNDCCAVSLHCSC